MGRRKEEEKFVTGSSQVDICVCASEPTKRLASSPYLLSRRTDLPPSCWMGFFFSLLLCLYLGPGTSTTREIPTYVRTLQATATRSRRYKIQARDSWVTEINKVARLCGNKVTGPKRRGPFD